MLQILALASIFLPVAYVVFVSYGLLLVAVALAVTMFFIRNKRLLSLTTAFKSNFLEARDRVQIELNGLQDQITQIKERKNLTATASARLASAHAKVRMYSTSKLSDPAFGDNVETLTLRRLWRCSISVPFTVIAALACIYLSTGNLVTNATLPPKHQYFYYLLPSYIIGFSIIGVIFSDLTYSVRARLRREGDSDDDHERYSSVQKVASRIHFWFTVMSAFLMIGLFVAALAKTSMAVLDVAYVKTKTNIESFSNGGTDSHTESKPATTPASRETITTPGASTPVKQASTDEEKSKSKEANTTNEEGVDEDLVVKILHGLELFIVAPLPYLLMLGLGRYIDAIAHDRGPKRAKAELLDFKGFEVSLLIAIIATSVVAAIVKGAAIDLATMIAAGFTMVVLIGYFWILENQEHQTESLISTGLDEALEHLKQASSYIAEGRRGEAIEQLHEFKQIIKRHGERRRFISDHMHRCIAIEALCKYATGEVDQRAEAMKEFDEEINHLRAKGRSSKSPYVQELFKLREAVESRVKSGSPPIDEYNTFADMQ